MTKTDYSVVIFIIFVSLLHLISATTGAEEAILNWLDRSSRHFERMKKCCYPYIHTSVNYNAQSTISMPSMLMLECLGAYPQEKFEKQVLKRFNLGVFQDLTKAVSQFN